MSINYRWENESYTMCVTNEGPINAMVMIIEVFSSPDEILYDIIQKSKLNSKNIHFVNLQKNDNVKIPNNWDDTIKLIDSAKEYINDLISQVQPMYIVLSGSLSLRIFTDLYPLTRFVNKEVQENIFCIHSTDYILNHSDQIEHTINIFKDIKSRLENNEKASTVSFSHTINTSQKFENMFDSQITEGE